MSEQNSTLEMARLGVEAEAFKHSPLGRFIEECAAREEEGYLEQLRIVDPEKTAEVRRIQNELKVIEMFRLYIDSVINSGRAAADDLTEQEAYSDE